MKEEQLTRTMREIIDMASRTAFKESQCTIHAVDLAKAYAASEVQKEIAAKDKEIGEIQRQLALCEHMKATSIEMLCANEDEIESLKSENKRLEPNPQWVNIPADTRNIALPEPRPSDGLLWEAYKQGQRVVHDMCGGLYRDNEMYFNEWIATLPADPLADDRALVASAFIEDDFEKELLKHAWNDQFVAAIKRLSGMEVNNE